MSDLSSYFVRWDQAFEEGRDLSPEELCPDQPELHDALRQVIAIMRLLRKNPSLGPRPADDDRSPDPAKQANKPVPPPRSGDAGKDGQPQSPPASSTWTDGRETSTSSDLALPTTNPPGYEILETLGKGGMGIVYLARQVKLNRIVALKMILTGFHQFRELRERFLIEAESIARINHPGIVQVYEFGMVGEVPFFSLEFCPGGNLAKRLTGTPLPAREVAQMVEKMADAVEAAHRAGIVHRDLKPANVLIDATGNPRISDFGLAKKIDEQGLTRPGVPLGTPCYMSPEQAQGVEGGKLTDVYALGGILYECLTGRPPFKGVSTHETLQQVLYQEPVPVRMLQPRAPVDLETISLKCLQKNPTRRYASAGELGEDLRRWLRGEPIHARPVGRLEKLWLWARRKPERAIACGLFLVFLAGSLIFASILSRQRQDRRESEARRNTKVESLLGEAHDNLEQPPPAKDFLAAWKAAVESASSALQRARDLEANEKVPLDPPVREQMRDLEHDLATMKSHIGLADQFERLQINRVFGRSLDHRMFPADVAQQYEKVFATIGIHVGGDIPAIKKALNQQYKPEIRTILLGALYEWAGGELLHDGGVWAETQKMNDRQKWLWDVIQQVDDDPWRKAFRDYFFALGKASISRNPGDWAILKKPMPEVDAATQPPVFLLTASTALEVASDLCADEPGSLLNWIRKSVRQNFQDQQLRLLRQAETAYPDHFWVVYELGLALYYMRNDQVGALSYFRAATAIKPEHHFVRYETGQCLMRLGKFVESLREFELAFENSPERGMLEHQTYLRYGVLQAIGGALILAEKGDIELPIAERKKLARKALPRFTHEVDRLEQLLRQGGPKVNAYYEELQLIPKYPVFSVFRENRKLAYLDEPGEQDRWDRLWKRIQDLEKQLQPRKK